MTDHCRDTGVVGLEKGNISHRYARNMGTFSIQISSVPELSGACIVGLGGLGGAVTEILARLGIGALTLVDGDVFEESNLNRQLLCTPKTGHLQGGGCPKPGPSNQSIGSDPHLRRVWTPTMPPVHRRRGCGRGLLEDLKTRSVLEKAAKVVEIPLVSAAIAGTYGEITDVLPQDPGLA